MELKLAHVEKGHPWSHHLQRTLDLCEKSVRRNRGPKSKAPAVDLEKVTKVKQVTNWGKKKGKLAFSKESFLFAAVWILREDELGNLCTSDVRVEDRLVFLYLANSKTDVEAEGTESTTVQVHGAVVQNPLPEEGLLPGPPPESLVPARGQGDEGGPLLVSASLGHEGSQSANSEILEGGLQDEDNGPLREKIRGLVLHQVRLRLGAGQVSGKMEIRRGFGIRCRSSRRKTRAS